MLQAVNISKKFKKLEILKNVSMEITEGKITALIGPSGGGKSVLVKILCSLMKPDSGSVLLKGEDVYNAGIERLRELRNLYGVLFQNLALFDFLNVRENVAFPLKQAGILNEEEMHERVTERLNDVGLAWAENLMAHELSGGMQRRVALARATISSSPLVIYDDPSAGLDPVTSSKIFLLIRKLHERDRSTVLVVSHDLDRLKPVCDYFCLLFKGEARFSGSFAEGQDCQDGEVREYFR
jgi:phospholipid/cholesterol/gamma-HCH transport system ATP-binding protein